MFIFFFLSKVHAMDFWIYRLRRVARDTFCAGCKTNKCSALYINQITVQLLNFVYDAQKLSVYVKSWIFELFLIWFALKCMKIQCFWCFWMFLNVDECFYIHLKRFLTLGQCFLDQISTSHCPRSGFSATLLHFALEQNVYSTAP